MRNIIALLIATVAVASPAVAGSIFHPNLIPGVDASARCDGDKECIAAMKRAPKPTKADVQEAKDSFTRAEIKARWHPWGFYRNLDTDEKWNEWFTTAEAKKAVADIQESERKAIIAARGDESGGYTSSFTMGDTYIRCTTRSYAYSSSTSCK